MVNDREDRTPEDFEAEHEDMQRSIAQQSLDEHLAHYLREIERSKLDLQFPERVEDAIDTRGGIESGRVGAEMFDIKDKDKVAKFLKEEFEKLLEDWPYESAREDMPENIINEMKFRIAILEEHYIDD